MGRSKAFAGQYLDIALLRGQYLDIAREGGFQSSFHPPFDPAFDLKVVQQNTPVIYKWISLLLLVVLSSL